RDPSRQHVQPGEGRGPGRQPQGRALPQWHDRPRPRDRGGGPVAVRGRQSGQDRPRRGAVDSRDSRAPERSAEQGQDRGERPAAAGRHSGHPGNSVLTPGQLCEVLRTMKEQIEALLSAIRSTWRFRWMALGVAWLVAILGTLLVLALPNKYQSRAQIYVDTRSVLRPLLQGLAVSPQTQDQTDVVRRALLARPSLDQVARKVGLYKRTHNPESAERLLTDLSDLIAIHGDTATGIYTITYSDQNPRTAQAVVKTLLDTFMEKSLGAGRTDTQNAESFLKQQVAQYEAALSQSEARLAEFKKKNVGLMPDQRGDYFGRLQAEVASLQKIRSDLAVAARQRDELRRKISGEENGQAILKTPPSAQDIQAATTLDARIRDSRHQLDELLLKFTDRHPEVLAVKDTIKRLEEQRHAELGGVRSTNGTVAQGSSVPVDPVVQNLQIGLNTADVQVASLQTQESQSAARVAELQRLVTTGPEVEAELARLNRDYGV